MFRHALIIDFFFFTMSYCIGKQSRLCMSKLAYAKRTLIWCILCAWGIWMHLAMCIGNFPGAHAERAEKINNKKLDVNLSWISGSKISTTPKSPRDGNAFRTLFLLQYTLCHPNNA